MFMSGRQNAGRIQNIKLAEFSVKCRNHRNICYSTRYFFSKEYNNHF